MSPRCSGLAKVSLHQHREGEREGGTEEREGGTEEREGGTEEREGGTEGVEGHIVEEGSISSSHHAFVY